MDKPQLSITKSTQMVTMYKDGKNMGQIASERGVPKRTVFDWVKQSWIVLLDNITKQLRVISL